MQIPRRKARQHVEASPAAVSYALLAGFAIGRRGRLLFETPWAALLDSSPGALLDITVDASRLGLIHLRHSGQIIDVSFPMMFTGREWGLLSRPHRQAG